MNADYFLDVDGFGELTIWRHIPERPDYPQPVLSRHDMRRCPDLWEVLVDSLKGGSDD